MRPVVIVHGAWHRPDHFGLLVDALSAYGLAVAVPDVGMQSLEEGTRTIQTVIDGFEEEPVLVAHSFGGVFAGALRGTAHQFFLSAFVLDVGETAGGWLAGYADDPKLAHIAGATRVSPDGRVSSIDPAQATALLYADCPPGIAADAVRLLRPDLASNAGAASDYAAWRHVPTSYLLAEDDPMWPSGLDGLFAERCAARSSLPTSHSAYLSRPEEVAALIRELV